MSALHPDSVVLSVNILRRFGPVAASILSFADNVLTASELTTQGWFSLTAKKPDDPFFFGMVWQDFGLNTTAQAEKLMEKFKPFDLFDCRFSSADETDTPQALYRLKGDVYAALLAQPIDIAVKSLRTVTQTSSLFDKFWEIYPAAQRQAKPKSLSIWRSKNLDRIGEVIINDVKARLENHKKWHEGYIPATTTYLNQERWGDPIVPFKPVDHRMKSRVIQGGSTSDMSPADQIASLGLRQAAYSGISHQ